MLVGREDCNAGDSKCLTREVTDTGDSMFDRRGW